MGQYVDRKTYFAIKNTLTAKERHIISYYELQWALRSRVPTISELTEYVKRKYPKTSQVEVNYALTRKPVTKALDERKIPWRQHSQVDLTTEQVACALTLMNFADTRSNDEKLDQLGINPSSHQAWLQDPQYKNLIDSLADKNLSNIRPTAVSEFTKLINKGDWNAIKYWFETTGELKQKDAVDTEYLLRAFVEVIQKHVKDPETIIAIATDLKMVAANRTLEVVTNTHSSPIYIDVESEEAVAANRKALGI